MTSSSCSQVRVGVRIRPLTDDEQSDGGKHIVSSSQHNSTVQILQRKFTFDGVYDESVTQSHLYSCVGADGMLEAFLEGYNSTIMAYGQTGSGKTFTMGSEADYSNGESSISSAKAMNSHYGDESKDVTNQGLIPRFMTDIFESLRKRKIQDQEHLDTLNKDNNDTPQQSRSQLIDYQVSSSFLEVYGEDIYDLLSEDSRKVLPLREDAQGGIVVVGLKEKKINSARDALQILHDGTLNRTTAATLMNKKSSRSHAVFTIILKQRTREFKDGPCEDEANTMDVTTVSRFTFVDLAGSERMKKTGAEGERAREGIKINQGLLALGNVINALADEERLLRGEKVHVPYRHSKLTRLLQDALGGNSQTLFLACVSPSDTNASETASTLKYANRARNIKNAPTKNIDATIAELQRLYTLNSVLERELVRVKFADGLNLTDDGAGHSDVGETSDELVNSEEVQNYLNKIREKAAESRANSSTTTAFVPCRDIPLVRTIVSATSQSSVSQVSESSNSRPASAKSRRQSVIDNMDDSILGVNPDEDIALLDKLLELQHIDQEFDKETKEDQRKLSEVEGELEAQEQLLLQLKDNMKGYHHLKDRFEAMMMEVQSLETEKMSLAKELESAQVDPSKGCSKAIKKRLDDVEAKLARARSETRRNQQMYRKAEQEAQKARVLQQKIESLKHGKVALIKKQREASAKYRESTEAKTREIQTLKKKERKTGQKMTKLEAEVQKHKANLQKRKAFCDKLSNKLKNTESHLMKVLSMRKREAAGRAKKVKAAKRSSIAKVCKNGIKDGFAPESEELSSLMFLLEKLILDRVNLSLLKSNYETKVTEYSDLMRSMVAEMKLLKEAKDNLRSCEKDDDISDIEQAIKDSKQTIEDLEFRLEVIEGDLERIRTKMPHIDESDVDDEPSKFESDAMKMIGNLSGPLSKSLLWEILEVATKSETHKTELNEKLKRKEAALSSFEKEIQCLNQQIIHLSQGLERRRSTLTHSSEDNSDYLSEILELKKKLASVQNDNSNLQKAIERNSVCLEEKEALLCTKSEELTIMEVALKNAGVEAGSQVQETLHKLQELWKVIGLPPNKREDVRLQIENCLEISCSDVLTEARGLERQYKEEIRSLSSEIKQTYDALGMQEDFNEIKARWPTDISLIRFIDTLQGVKAEIAPVFDSAMERMLNISSGVEQALAAMGMSNANLCEDLVNLMKSKAERHKMAKFVPEATSPMRKKSSRRATQFRQVEKLVRALETEQSLDDNARPNPPSKYHGINKFEAAIEPYSLSEEFLDRCETEMKKLKMEKTKLKVSNQTMREEAKQLTADMHLRGRELLSLSIHSIKKRTKVLPTWWDPNLAEEVCRSIVSRDTIIKVSVAYTKHLEAVHESLFSISKGRKLLSETLIDIVKNAHSALFQTVEGELDAGEAYSSFDAALSRLPPLSKENVNACIEEMRTLISAVDAMAQSEVEALTVVWDALNVSNSEKGVFWGTLEESTKNFISQPHHSFDSVLKACANDVEEWLLCAVKDAQKTHRGLSNSLLKLSMIHHEVEKLSTKQATKSKIMSLDSELCILSAKLCEFEEKANSKQRLTKKTNSASLLKEEKFRKQMQSNFTLKLRSLSGLLSDWQSLEGRKFDNKMLSSEVSNLLKNPDGVERRTAFMHLKTVQQRTKRHHISPSPSRYRRSEVSSNVSISSRPIPRQSYARTPIDSRGKDTGRKRVRSRQRSPLSDSTATRTEKSRSPHRSRINRVKDRSKSPAKHTVRSTTPLSTKRSPIRMDTKSTSPTKNRLSKTKLANRKDDTPSTMPLMQLNRKSGAKTPPRRKQKSLSVNNSDKNESPILPFGQILAKTPKGKENFKF